RQNWPRIIDAPAGTEPPPRDVCSSHFAETKLDLPQMARKLRRARRLSATFRDAVSEAKQGALKQFAYGLSHEINNPLANISVRAQGLMREEENADRKVSLQRIVDQAMRAHEMVADLMFFSHPPAPHLVGVELTAVLRQVAHQIGNSVADRGIEVRICPPAAPISLQADRAMIAEAVRALIRNAVEAIGCDGRIDVQCSLQGDKTPAVASIVVRDSGPGLSEAAQQHAFDPYFSGREAGRGLGVGLCRVKRIAELHGGGVSLSSGPAGCIARVWIPVRA
ncbi:MAG: sensor histidine kinase, partial [Planctomycetaceae bacterium]